jgi:ABC-type uncharacterized transport system substrate-binding protein
MALIFQVNAHFNNPVSLPSGLGGGEMTRQFFLTLILGAALVSTTLAHPHAFVECAFSFVMDKDGLVGFKQKWVLDEMTTVSVLDVVDKDRNGVLSADEKIAVRNLTEDSLLAYHYFTVANVNGENFPVREIRSFSAELQNGKLIYTFVIPCRVAAIQGLSQEVKVAVYDDSFYTYVAYVEESSEGSGGLDPAKDPLFMKREAPASPEDFKRFSSAVGIGKFSGNIRIRGDTSRFDCAVSVQDERKMAYFYDQIIPQAFILQFKLK